MDSAEGTVIIEAKINSTPQQVWEAISQKSHMVKWMFSEINEFKAEFGFETSFSVRSESAFFLHQWRVLDVMPPRKLVLEWKYGGYPGDSTVTFEIFDEDQKSRIRVIHQGIDSFPQDVPEFKKEACISGWEFLIQNRLKEYLEQ